MKLPVWKCHKEVEGFKIHNITAQPEGTHSGNIPEVRYVQVPHEGGVELLPTAQKTEYILASENPEVFAIVDDSYMLKHGPHIGGYFVRYEDSYESFSPANSFENGYTPINSKKVIHIKAGSDDWWPNGEDLQALAELFHEASLDPTGSVIVTSRHVNLNVETVLHTEDGAIFVTSFDDERTLHEALFDRASERNE